MEVLLRSIGFDDEESARFAVLVEDRIGIVFEVSKILKEQQINIRSLVTWPEKEYPGVFQLVMRICSRSDALHAEGINAANFLWKKFGF